MAEREREREREREKEREERERERERVSERERERMGPDAQMLTDQAIYVMIKSIQKATKDWQLPESIAMQVNRKHNTTCSAMTVQNY